MHRTPIAILGAALLALTGCTGDEAPEDPLDEQVGLGLEADGTDEERLLTAVAHGQEVDFAIAEIIARLERRCMEDEGFTVHDETVFYVPDFDPEQMTLVAEPPSANLPTAEEAAEQGFMVWPLTHDGSEFAPPDENGEALAEYQELLDGPFYDLPAEETAAWSRAYYGAEVVKARSDVEDDPLDVPEPGGCNGEVHRAIYGEPQKIVEESLGEEYAYWNWGVVNPLIAESDHYDDIESWRELVAEEERAFLTCLDESGNPGWDLDHEGQVDVYWYVYDFYPPKPENEGVEFDIEAGGMTGLMPELRTDTPYDYDTAFAEEVALAEVFAGCADDTGYREAGETQWRALHIGRMLEHETEVFAWQEEMDAYLATAQDLLEA